MSALLSIRAAGPLVGARDPRTILKRLGALGVPIVEFEGHKFVDPTDVARAVRAHARPLEGDAPVRAGGVELAPGERLWDGRPTEVGPRRVNGRPRGSRELALQAAQAAYGTPVATLATSSTSRSNGHEVER